MNKAAIVILDGLGDRPQTTLNGLTPLEAARTPNLDALVKRGMCGMVDPLSPGMPVGTQTGAGLLMGMDPNDVHKLSRGIVESAGVNLNVKPGDIAIRCNFATIKKVADGWSILDRRAGRIREETKALASALDGLDLGNGITASFEAATQHRAVLKLSGSGLTDEISDTDPGSASQNPTFQACFPLNAREGSGERTAAAINSFFKISHDILQSHTINKQRSAKGLMPANAVLCRGAGQGRHVKNIINRFGFTASVIAGELTILGLARLFNFNPITSPTFTSSADTDIHGKIKSTIQALNQSDLAFLHIKAPDIFSHDIDPIGKSRFLEKMDGELGPLLEQNIVIGISADHSTDSRTGNHTGDPVPSIIFNPHGRRDSIQTFGESSCMQGGIGRILSHQFLLSVLDAVGLISNYRPSIWT